MIKFSLGALALLLSGSALAQQLPPPADQQEIVIRANRVRDRDERIRQFVQAVTVAEPNYRQLSRFELPACPMVVGLGQPQDRMIADRMRQVAAAVGIETGREGCHPNALVIVADDKEATMAWMRRKLPNFFVDSIGRPILLRKEKGPAQAWHVGGLRDSTGREAGIVLVGETPSMVHPMGRPHFLASVLIVEARALAGLTTTEFADYAAMRAFAQLDPARLKDRNAPTILTILDAPAGAEVPLTLTGWDLAFLRGLYASEENAYAETQRREIQRAMNKDLSRAEDQSPH